MTLSFALSRRIGRLRASVAFALIAALAACDNNNSLEPITSTTLDGEVPVAEAGLGLVGPSLASVAYAGGIPFGMFRQPTSEFGSRFNGAMRNIAPNLLRSELAAIKNRGGKVALMMVGPEHYYKDADGHFSLSKWKLRMDRFKGVDITSYINDGTIIGHYLIDEPNDPANWGGRPLTQATVDELAHYSKQRWPGMVTIARVSPEWLGKYSGSYRYLDAAWAQYLIHRWPNAQEFIRENVAKAKAKGLALIIGMNVIHGGSKRLTKMTASQVKSYGTTLLNDSYPCAFISWQYRDSYMTSGIRDAMSYLRNKAENRANKTCRGS